MFDWITGLVEDGGYVGVFLLMFLENVFPPIPSELIMPLAGFVAARGDISFLGVIVAGTLGSLLGTSLWFALGMMVGIGRIKRLAARHGRWLTMSPDDVTRAQEVFARYGVFAIFFGRLIPAIRTLISVPAGLAQMKLPIFLFWTALGTSVWTTALASAGYLLESQYALIEGQINTVSNVILVLVLIWYVYRVISFERTRT
ncbi:MAG: DedA family protein [Pseudomonadota bacterium]